MQYPVTQGNKKMKKAPSVKIYTDGACSDGKGGWAASLFYEGQALYICGNEDNTTNNRMELTAIVRSLQQLICPCTVELYSDSQYCVNGINIWMNLWKKNSWRNNKNIPINNPDLWKDINKLAKKHKIKAIWVKGHNGDPGNELVNDLAQLLRQKPMA